MSKIKTVLITGCSTGIGRALSIELAKLGCQVFATARKLDAIADLKSPNISLLALDILDSDSIQQAFADMLAEVGQIDMLINNAGISHTGPFAEASFESLKQIVDTNISGTMAVTQRAFATMAKQGHGRVVNIGSVVGDLPVPFTATYCATKAALHMLSDVLRMEFKPFNLDVITVQPASVRTEIEFRSAHEVSRYNQPDSRYQPLYSFIEKRFKGNDATGMEVNQFARQIAAKLIVEKAPRLITAGANNGLLQTLKRFPATLRDWIMRKEYGLDKTL